MKKILLIILLAMTSIALLPSPAFAICDAFVQMPELRQATQYSVPANLGSIPVRAVCNNEDAVDTVYMWTTLSSNGTTISTGGDQNFSVPVPPIGERYFTHLFATYTHANGNNDYGEGEVYVYSFEPAAPTTVIDPPIACGTSDVVLDAGYPFTFLYGGGYGFNFNFQWTITDPDGLPVSNATTEYGRFKIPSPKRGTYNVSATSSIWGLTGSTANLAMTCSNPTTLKIDSMKVWQIIDSPQYAGTDSDFDLVNNKVYAVRLKISENFDSYPNLNLRVKVDGEGFRTDEYADKTDSDGELVIKSDGSSSNTRHKGKIKVSVRKLADQDPAVAEVNVEFHKSKQVNLNFWRLKDCKGRGANCYAGASETRFTGIKDEMGVFSDRVLPISNPTNAKLVGTFSGNRLIFGAQSILQDLLDLSLRRRLFPEASPTTSTISADFGVVSDEYFKYQGKNDPAIAEYNYLGSLDYELGVGIIREQISDETKGLDSTIGEFILSRFLGIKNAEQIGQRFSSLIETELGALGKFTDLLEISNNTSDPAIFPRSEPVLSINSLWINSTFFPNYVNALIAPGARRKKVSAGPLLLATGIILPTGSFQPYYWYKASQGEETASDQDPNIFVRLYDVSDNLISEKGVKRSLGTSSLSRFGLEQSAGKLILLAIPFPQNVARFELMKDGAIIYRSAPMAKLLRDSLDLVPDQILAGDPASTRVALQRDADTFESLILAKKYIEAGSFLHQTLQSRVASDMNSALPESPLEMSKASILSGLSDLEIRTTFIANELAHGADPLLRLSSDKAKYQRGERANLKAELLRVPLNKELEYYAEAKFNGAPIRIDRANALIFGSSSPKLEAGGIWNVSVFLQNKRLVAEFSAFIAQRQKAILGVDKELEMETDPEKIQKLQEKKVLYLKDIENTKDQLQNSRTPLRTNVQLTVEME